MFAAASRTLVYRYSPAADGKRFLIVAQVEDAASVPVTVVLNWIAGLKR